MAPKSATKLGRYLKSSTEHHYPSPAPTPLDIQRIIHSPLLRWITKCHTCQNWWGKWLSSRAQQPAVPWAFYQHSHHKMPPLTARTLLCANTSAAFCWKPFGKRREATGLLSAATLERLQKCFNNFLDICCNIQQLGARARALTSLPHPRGGNVCTCWQPCGRFRVGHNFGFCTTRMTHQWTLKKLGIVFFLLYVISSNAFPN